MLICNKNTKFSLTPEHELLIYTNMIQYLKSQKYTFSHDPIFNSCLDSWLHYLFFLSFFVYYSRLFRSAFLHYPDAISVFLQYICSQYIYIPAYISVSYYTDVLGYSLLAGSLFAPLVGMLVDRALRRCPVGTYRAG